MIIVLTTSGKNDDFDNVKVTLHENVEEALEYCNEHTDNPMDEKYWTYSEIIKNGIEYEPSRYKNY